VIPGRIQAHPSRKRDSQYHNGYGMHGPPDRPAEETAASPLRRYAELPAAPAAVVRDRYRVLELLGTGGMGAVYRAEDLRLRRSVALKFLYETNDRDPIALARLEREARAASALSHPNICTLFDLAEENGRPFLVLEYLAGETLAARLRRSALSLAEILDSAIQVADALDSAHQHGIIHRDIKPANLFLTTRGQTKILDFGVAKLSRVLPGEPETLTLSGNFVGTAAYVAPEQARGAEIDARADLFSFGAVLYEMASGRPAFSAPSMALIFEALLHRDPPPLASDVPARLKAIIWRALAKDRRERYPDALRLLSDLRNFKQNLQAPQNTVMRVIPSFADSIAVLPFENKSSDPNLEYLGEGIAERILNSLSQVASLRVIPRATAFHYHGRDALQAAKDLDVRVVLTGRVTERAGRLVIGTELIDGARGALLWGEKYDRGLDDMVALESEIAHEIATKLRVRLSPEEADRLLEKPTHNVEAYKLLMRAMYYANRWTRDGLQKGIALLHQALEADPAFPAAYAGLGYIYILLGFFGAIPPRDAYPKAKSAALRILEFEEQRASAHLLLGFVALSFDWDWLEAEKHIGMALRLAPNYANAHWALGYFLCAMGRFDEAITAMQQAVALDPLSAPIRAGLATAYYWSRRYDLAAQAYRDAIDVDPQFKGAYHVLAVIAAEQGRFDEAFRYLDQCGDDPHQLERERIARALVHAIQGDADAALQALRQLGEKHPGWAAVYALLGDDEKTLDLLERSFQNRDSYLVLLANNPSFERQYKHPRFMDLVRRIGFPGTAAR